jgi:hypothetical protein
MPAIRPTEPAAAATSPFDLLQTLCHGLRRDALHALSYHDFGFPEMQVEGYFDALDRLLPDLGCALANDRAVRSALEATEGSSWNAEDCTKDLRESACHAVGAMLLTERVRYAMDRSDVQRALLAKILYEHLTEILDDVIDAGSYGRRQCEQIFRTALVPIGDPGFRTEPTQRRLLELLSREQRGYASPVAKLGTALSDLLLGAPRWADLGPAIRIQNEYVAIGQSLSTTCRGYRIDLQEVRRRAARFDSPEVELTWVERLAKYQSQVSNLALLDLCFVRREFELGNLGAALQSWYYYDVVISLLDHLFDLRADTEEEVANLALLWMSPDACRDAITPSDAYRALRMSDYERLVSRVAELSARALTMASSERSESAEFYRFLTVMIPVVMFAVGRDQDPDLLHSVLRALVPVVRVSPRAISTSGSNEGVEPSGGDYHSTTYSQWSSPFRTQRVFTTLPFAPRAASMPSYTP